MQFFLSSVKYSRTSFFFALLATLHAEMAKEGTGSTTAIHSGTLNTVELDENHLVLVYQNKGAIISDISEGSFHNMFLYNVEVMYFENGVGKLLGCIICTDPEGDKICRN